MNMKIYLAYLVLIAGTTYLIRAIPFAFVKKEIKNHYIQSFLQYIPYSVLAAMTFPAILYSTTYVSAATVGLIIAIICAWFRRSMVKVASIACITVFLLESLIRWIS